MTQPDTVTLEILQRVVTEVRDPAGARIYTRAEMIHAIKMAREHERNHKSTQSATPAELM